MEVPSPVTASNNTSKIDSFDTKRIIDLYSQIGIGARRFFKDLDEISLYQCNDTAYRFYYPYSIFGDDQFYQELYTTIPNYYLPTRWEYGYAFSQVKPGSKVLEIGCGSGLFLERLKVSKCDVTGLELNSKAIADCRKKGLTVHAELIEPYSENHSNVYDVVCTFQVLEHVSNVKSFISSAIKTLKPGGKLIISVPNSNPYFHKHDKYHTLNLPPHHSGLWNKYSLEKLTEYFPIKLENIKTEPLKEFKEWYLVQMKYHEKNKPWLASLMKLVPRFVYKRVLKIFSKSIEGAYITAVYQKIEND